MTTTAGSERIIRVRRRLDFTDAVLAGRIIGDCPRARVTYRHVGPGQKTRTLHAAPWMLPELRPRLVDRLGALAVFEVDPPPPLPNRAPTHSEMVAGLLAAAAIRATVAPIAATVSARSTAAGDVLHRASASLANEAGGHVQWWGWGREHRGQLPAAGWWFGSDVYSRTAPVPIGTGASCALLIGQD